MKIALKLIIKINNENDHKYINAPFQIYALLEIKTNQVSHECEVDMQWFVKLVYCGPAWCSVSDFIKFPTFNMETLDLALNISPAKNACLVK